MQDKIRDIRLGKNSTTKELVNQLRYTGFQATDLTRGVDLIKEMKKQGCTIFLSFTSNLVASGVRGVLLDFISRGYADVVVTAGGSIDHDVIRSLDDYNLGEFDHDDVKLHKQGINRLGNILVPNKRYELFEKWIQEVLLDLYNDTHVVSPKELSEFIGKRISNKNSILHLCSKKRSQCFHPALSTPR